MSRPRFAFVESNTSGTGPLFAQEAATEGFRPILFAANPARYAHPALSEIEVLPVDTADRHALLVACRQLPEVSRLAGIWSSSEYFVETAAWLAAACGLPGPSPDAVRECRDKEMQRVRLAGHAVPVPRCKPVTGIGPAVAAARDIGLPVIVKPVSGTGSIGVRLCRTLAEVRAHSKSLLRTTVNERGMPIPRRILVEEAAAGPEFSVEIFDGQVIGVTRKFLGPLPSFVEVGHDFPALLSAGEEKAITACALRAVAVLELGWGPIHVELRLTPAGPRIIEVNPRLAGGYIPDLVHLAIGVNLIRATIRAAAGRDTVLARKRNRYACIRFITLPAAGSRVEIHGLEAARRIDGVIEVRVYERQAGSAAPCGDFRDRIGHIITSRATLDAARVAASCALAACTVHVFDR